MLSGTDGQLTGDGAGGVYLADQRVLSRLAVTVDGHGPVPVRGQSTGTATARFVGVVRHLGDPGPDPTVFLERDRTVTPRGARETISLVSRAREPLACTVTVELDADLAAIGEVKAGRPAATPPPHPDLDEPGTVRWQIGRDAAVLATLSPEPYGVRTAAPSRVLARWEVALPVRGRWSATLEVTAVAPAARRWPRRRPGSSGRRCGSTRATTGSPRWSTGPSPTSPGCSWPIPRPPTTTT